MFSDFQTRGIHLSSNVIVFGGGAIKCSSSGSHFSCLLNAMRILCEEFGGGGGRELNYKELIIIVNFQECQLLNHH